MKHGPLAAFCRALPGATEDIKWEHDRVFSICGKMFAAFDAEQGERFSFRASPATFLHLMALDGIVPAPYLARYNWIRVERLDALPHTELEALLRDSYDLVVARPPARLRNTVPMQGGA